jgi:tellurite resistance protein TerA
MGLFGKSKSTQVADTFLPAPTPAPAVDLGKRTGKLSLEKGQKVSIEKTQEILATVSWPSSTDYDVFALVLFRDGHTETCATYGTTKNKNDIHMSVGNGAVRHRGDVVRPDSSGVAVEELEVRLNPDIVAVVPVAYSAKSNGTGSFYRYKVTMAIDNGAGTRVQIDAKHANDDDRIYTCVPGIIRNTSDGVQIEALELYSQRNNENRPVLLANGTIKMDAGPENASK